MERREVEKLGVNDGEKTPKNAAWGSPANTTPRPQEREGGEGGLEGRFGFDGRLLWPSAENMVSIRRPENEDLKMLLWTMDERADQR